MLLSIYTIYYLYHFLFIAAAWNLPLGVDHAMPKSLINEELGDELTLDHHFSVIKMTLTPCILLPVLKHESFQRER